ncbi:MAG: hypothetical protein ACRDRG_03170 [Pseudonocardiaceae bacterium]
MTTEKYENVEYEPQGQTTWPIMGVPRRVRVKGMAGVDATVVVTVVQDTVRLSISPPFTWEAIMKSGKIDEVISMLELARDEAKKVATARNGSASRGGKAIVRTAIRNGSATQ